MLSSLLAFAKKTPEGWKIDPPKAVSDQELISTAVTIYIRMYRATIRRR